MLRTRRQFVIGGAVAAGAAAYDALRPTTGKSGLERPNLLVIVVDTLRVDHSYGPRAATPNIDALAARALRFTNVYPEAMPTVPARNSILTGRRRFPFRNWRDHRGLLAKPGWEPVEDVDSTFTSALRRSGYWTGYVTDNPFLGFAAPYEPLRRSFDVFMRTGGQLGGRIGGVPKETLRHWLHPAASWGSEVERVSRYIANANYSKNERRSFAARVFGNGVRALDRAARNRPFALVVDTFQPHEPWTPPARYLRLNGTRPSRSPEPAYPRYTRVRNWLDPDEDDRVLRRMRALYAAEVSLTDRWIGHLLERLHDLDLERETIVLLVSDHGILLGEHGWTGKISIALHPELIHVPLIIAHPDHPDAGESAYLASTHDIGPTLLSLAGVRAPRTMTGHDLSPLLQGGTPKPRAYAYGGYTNTHYVRNERWSYMCDNRLKDPRLFDLSADPGEVRNVADKYPDVVAELAGVIEQETGGRLPYYE